MAPGHLGTITVAGEPHLAPWVRRYVRNTLSGSNPHAEDIELCVCELFSNAIRHTASGRHGRVRIAVGTVDSLIHVDVTDEGGVTTFPWAWTRSLNYDPGADGGYGLRLVAAMAKQYGVETGKHGTTVWFEML